MACDAAAADERDWQTPACARGSDLLAFAGAFFPTRYFLTLPLPEQHAVYCRLAWPGDGANRLVAIYSTFFIRRVTIKAYPRCKPFRNLDVLFAIEPRRPGRRRRPNSAGAFRIVICGCIPNMV